MYTYGNTKHSTIGDFLVFRYTFPAGVASFVAVCTIDVHDLFESSVNRTISEKNTEGMHVFDRIPGPYTRDTVVALGLHRATCLQLVSYLSIKVRASSLTVASA